MNQGPLVFLVAFFAMATSWLGFVLVPQLQLGRQDQVVIEDTGQLYPSRRPGEANQGAQVYRANGCFYCHTEQTRYEGFGSDVKRGWGARPSKVQSVAQDYLYDQPVMLGSQRVGPDLANIGFRQTNATWLLLHLYNPRATSPGSVMPPYRYLFQTVHLKIGEKPSADALPVDAGKDCEIVPTPEARSLVAYMLSLHSEATFYEAPTTNRPPPVAATNAPAGVKTTNAPAAAKATNLPAATTPSK